MTKDIIFEKLKKSLEKIGWCLFNVGCEHYVPVDQKGRHSKFVYWKGELKLERNYDEVCEVCLFKLDDLKKIRFLDNKKTVVVGDKENFILFMNHEK